MKISICGKTWELTYVPNLGPADGTCDPPWKPGKKIRVKGGLADPDHLETIIHECLHASAFNVLDEEFVTDTAHDIAEILTRLGYARHEN